jgi:prepilin peptidase CpaA
MTCALLAALLLAATFTDLRSRRIPNALVLAGLAAGVACHALALAIGGAPLAGSEWWSPLAGLATGFAVMMPLYLLRATGAGDAKLLAMVGAFIGAPTVLAAALYMLVAGGLLSLVFMLGRGVAAETIANVRFLFADWVQRAHTGQGMRLAPLATTAARLPYAVAIALGTAAALRWPLLSP